MRDKLIYNGATYSGDVTAGGLSLKHSMAGETLSVDSLTKTVYTSDEPIKFITADMTKDDYYVTSDPYVLTVGNSETNIGFIPNGEGDYYVDGFLIARFYLDEIKQTTKYEHSLLFYSAIKLLDQSDHVGGLYTGQRADAVIADIMGSIPYVIDGDVASAPVNGYLPYSTRRNNLQLVLMAVGGALRNTTNGALRVTTLSPTVTGTIDTDRVFFGGSIVDRNAADVVEVTEHNFMATPDVVTLYDNTTLSAEMIVFNEPVKNLIITNGTILESGVNYCKFAGEGYVTLTGEKYLHVQRVVSHGNGDIVKRVTSNTLISPFNAANVAERLYDFLSVAQSIKCEVVFGTERPGDVVSIIHPYTNEPVEACIKALDVSIGATELRANGEFLIGYKPKGAVEGFTNHEFFGSWITDTFTVPAGVTKIRAILIGPGHSGEPGEPGEAGGAGGKGGNGGAGGLVLEINMDVTPGQEIVYRRDKAGEGDTTFGPYSSVTGRPYPHGYYEPKTNKWYCRAGKPGIDGGRGSSSREDGNEILFGGVVYRPGENHSNGISYGGGAAAGQNGGPGQPWEWNQSGDGSMIQVGGKGGTGADAGPPDGHDYDPAWAYDGQGGSGGNGGGGGGKGSNLLFGGDGPGGAGSAPTPGRVGAVIVYY